jgi:acetyltransferase-like isoleucine patch superfamily enzyme
MPGYRYHGFAEASIYDYAPPGPRGLLSRLWTLLAVRLFWKIELEQVRWVCDAFSRGAIVGRDLRVTARAWCVNPARPENIRLGESVICRGLIRIERFHEGHVVIGDNVLLGDDSIISCAERVEVGSFTMLAHGVQIFDNDSHPLDIAQRERDYLIASGRLEGDRPGIGRAAVWIGDHCWIGTNSLVMKGVRIGPGSVVAAGSVVVSDVPPFTVAAGNPARVVRSLASGSSG